ncbi:hypothetical protein BY996DRAFT_6503938 [Phakopsora pachyrhizi]|nr:hypothetical protein BY996DRAFT_6503938 [Phakopsora pachyrhizi]
MTHNLEMACTPQTQLMKRGRKLERKLDWELAGWGLELICLVELFRTISIGLNPSEPTAEMDCKCHPRRQ